MVETVLDYSGWLEGNGHVNRLTIKDAAVKADLGVSGRKFDFKGYMLALVYSPGKTLE